MRRARHAAAAKWAFSSARSWQTWTLSAAGATMRCAPSVTQRGGGHVLELRRDRRATLHQLRQALLVEVAGLDVVVGDAARRADRVGIEHGGEVAHLLRGVHEHAAELAAAHHAERRAGCDEAAAVTAGATSALRRSAT